ncbi:GlxA family transcriptional regulator [Antarcticirhabdus aurantiaca]|uniref:GlxA family transcriptional regulator n=1 Tax=Antarcticirhabdus aurantiaca TaxID=2606717 RepID=A0ACD4NQI3_9HYPH|nr:GlxA family transcriptional regulator [Antarcticirhabdus aurantiaca]WAJ29200.1 GlxA family transcriptional regulator [Jeongeuplla avenae]
MVPSIFRPDPAVLVLDILVLPGFSLLTLASTVEPLRAANRLAGRPLFRWRLVSPDGAEVPASSGLRLGVDAAFDPAETAAEALLVVAAFDWESAAGPPLLAGLRALARRGIALGGIEAGTWVLAKAGLLANRRATTHWEDFEAFAAAFPQVSLAVSRFVVDGDRFTTGGASPALDLMLELIRARQGQSLALGVAGIFVYDPRHAGEDPQASLSLARLAAREPRVAAVLQAMEARIERPLSVAALAKRAGLSRRRLETLFRELLNLSPGEAFERLRLEHGRRLVLETRDEIASVGQACGFGSASAFARAFRRRYGESPTQARRARREGTS